MVNILPPETRDRLRMLYYMRLLSTWALTAALVFVLGGALLVPSYILAEEEAGSGSRFTDAIQGLLALKKEGTNDVAVVSEQTQILNAYAGTPFAAVIVGEISAARTAGVSLRKISLAVDEQGMGAITLSGKAATRSALSAFVEALQKSPRFRGVAVPVSNLASDTNLEFSLSFAFSMP